MATIKSFTDIPQSKKLAEILPLKSADMCYSNDGTAIKIDANPYTVRYSMWKDCAEIIPCWSLAALLGTLAKNKICHYDDRYYCQYMGQGDEFPIYSTAEYDNPVDACVDMIIKLSELKML